MYVLTNVVFVQLYVLKECDYSYDSLHAKLILTLVKNYPFYR